VDYYNINLNINNQINKKLPLMIVGQNYWIVVVECRNRRKEEVVDLKNGNWNWRRRND